MISFEPNMKAAMEHLTLQSEIFAEYETDLDIYKHREKMLVLRQAKLQHIIEHAFKTVPFYTERYKAYASQIEEGRVDEIFTQLPLLEKDDLRSSFFDLVSNNGNLKGCSRNRTSGSSGIPTVNLHDNTLHLKYFLKNQMLYKKTWGISDFGRILMIVPNRFKDNRVIYPEYRIESNSLSKVWYLPTDISSDEFISCLQDINPTIIYGNPHLIIDYINKCESSFINLDALEAVISSFELLDNEMSEVITSYFKSKIIDVYGFSEIGDVAWQCPENKHFHINDLDMYFEVVDDNGKPVFEKEGHIVVTSFYNISMPLIRYKVGDIGILSRKLCSCGNQSMLLKKVLGRNVDFIVRDDGHLVSPYDVMSLLEIIKVDRFKFVQESINSFSLFYVSEKVMDENHILTKLKNLLGGSIDVRFHKVQEILSKGKTKIKTIESKVRRKDEVLNNSIDI